VTGVTWTFQRSDQAAANGEHLIRVEYRTMDPDTSVETVMVFVLTESAAIGMRNDLSQVTGGLTIARTMGDG